MVSSLTHLAAAAEALFPVPKSPEITKCLNALLAAVQTEEKVALRRRFFSHAVAVDIRLQEALRIRIAVSDALFKPLRQLLDEGDIAAFSEEELIMLYKDLPDLSDILSPERVERVSTLLFQAIPSRFPGCTMQHPQTLVIRATVAPDLVAASRNIRFEDIKEFCSFLAENKEQSFEEVESLDLNFSECLSAEESKELCAIFPYLSSLHLYATTMEATTLATVVEQSGLRVVFCRDCRSLEPFQLETWDLDTTVFFVGDTLPQYTSDVENKGSVECVFVDHTRPLILDMQAVLTDDDVHTLLSHVGEIQGLHIENSLRLTDKAICAIARVQKNLKTFSCEDFFHLTDEAIKALATNCPELESVEIPGSDKVTDRSLLPLIRSCSKLTSLDLDSTLVTDTALRLFLEQHSHIHYLNLSHCENITNEVVRYIIEKQLRIDELWIDPLLFDPDLVSDLQNMDSVQLFFCE